MNIYFFKIDYAEERRETEEGESAKELISDYLWDFVFFFLRRGRGRQGERLFTFVGPSVVQISRVSGRNCRTAIVEITPPRLRNISSVGVDTVRKTHTNATSACVHASCLACFHSVFTVRSCSLCRHLGRLANLILDHWRPGCWLLLFCFCVYFLFYYFFFWSDKKKIKNSGSREGKGAHLCPENYYYYFFFSKKKKKKPPDGPTIIVPPAAIQFFISVLCASVRVKPSTSPT